MVDNNKNNIPLYVTMMVFLQENWKSSLRILFENLYY